MNPSYESEDDDADEGSKILYSTLNVNAKAGGADKGYEPISDQGLHENKSGGVSNTCDKQKDHFTANDSSVSENQAMLSSASETAMVDSPSINTTETEEIWYYRDPSGEIQGPFSMKQLRFWSTMGYFPADMKIWNDNEKDNSILLTDALIGKFHKVCQLRNSNMSMESSEEARNNVDNKVHVSLKLDLNDKGFNAASSTNPQKSSERDSNVLNLPSPNSETGTGNLEIPCLEHHESVHLEIRTDDMKGSITKDIRISDPPSSPRPKRRDDNLIAARVQNEPSEIPVEDSGLSREPESAKTSTSSSLQVSEMVTTNLVATPNSNQNVSCWQAIKERIEFSTLADESVSDLLAEIDAMEFQNGSPTCAAMNDVVDRNDCFSSIEDPGKSDALSSTADFPFPNLEAVMDDLFGKSDAYNPPSKRSCEVHSTTSSSSYIHPSAPSTMNHQAVVSENVAHNKSPETMNHGFEAGTPQAGTSWVNPSFNIGVNKGNESWDNTRIYGCETIPGSSVMDAGFGSNRQFHGGGDGGEWYSSRSPLKEQRVCKYYQNGHCKKGASCDCLHK